MRYTKTPRGSSVVVNTMDDGKGLGASTTTKSIERSFRERRRGFLVWALRNAPDAARAEEAVQDAFMRALANADALAPVEDLAAWIFQAMRNRLVDLWRRESAQRRAGATDIAPEVIENVAAEAGFDAQDQYQRAEILAALDVAVAALPTSQRDVIRAQALGETGFKELAEATGVSIDTLMARKRYAIQKLAAALKIWNDD